MGHAVQPVADLCSGPDGRRLADEDEESGLERILGVVVIAQNTAADAPDHSGMPAHEHFESRCVLPAEEALQQLPIGQFCRSLQKPGSAKVLDG